MKAVLESLSWNDEAQARMRFVVTWLALTGARRSELGAGTTSQLSRVRSGDDEFVLWKRMGKQGAVNENLVDQLAVMSLLRYRLTLNKPLKSIWEGGDEPLVFALGGRDRVKQWKTNKYGDTIIYEIVSAFASLCAANATSTLDAARLSSMAPQWLRHRCARMLLTVPNVNLHDVRNRMNHTSLSTTGLYAEYDVLVVGLRLVKAKQNLNV
jgi:integrase